MTAAVRSDSPPSRRGTSTASAAGSGGPSVLVLAGLFAIFLGLPIITLIARAILDGSLVQIAGTSPVLAALALSLTTTAVSVVLTVAIGLPLALVLARRTFRGKWFVEALVDIPIVLPPAVAGLALLLVFGRRGLLSAPLQVAGLDIAFTTIAVILAQTFVSAPFFVRAARAGIAGVDRDLEDAARVDGAGPAARFFRVVLPQLAPVVLFNLVIGTIAAFQIFAQAYVMTGGGPGDASRFLVLYLYETGFRHLDMGYASAIAWSLFLVLAAITALVLASSRRWVHYAARSRA